MCQARCWVPGEDGEQDRHSLYTVELQPRQRVRCSSNNDKEMQNATVVSERERSPVLATFIWGVGEGRTLTRTVVL